MCNLLFKSSLGLKKLPGVFTDWLGLYYQLEHLGSREQSREQEAEISDQGAGSYDSAKYRIQN